MGRIRAILFAVLATIISCAFLGFDAKGGQGGGEGPVGREMLWKGHFGR